jgi:hypothetical protein
MAVFITRLGPGEWNGEKCNGCSRNQQFSHITCPLDMAGR